MFNLKCVNCEANTTVLKWHSIFYNKNFVTQKFHIKVQKAIYKLTYAIIPS